jgi:hypothetical protein
MRKTTLALVFATGLLAPPPADADVNIGITVAPPPPLVVTAPPPLVVVPGTPVHHAPSLSFNLFVYSGRYYSLHNGVWFVATKPGAQWVVVATDRVPKPVLGVPVKYYKVPPGHAKKLKDGGPGGPPGHAKGPKGK